MWRVPRRILLFALGVLLCSAARSSAQRPVQCGDFVLGGAETCDDGNTADGDGCSAACTLEAGYMCRGFGRAAADALGVGLEQAVDGTYTLSGAAEACTGDAVCAIGGLWQPELWGASLTGAVPPRAFYCGDYCPTFGTYNGMEFDGACQLADADECATGDAACDFNAVCENTLFGAGDAGAGYQCRCDPYYFAVQAQGRECAPNGLELVLRVVGAAAYNSLLVPPTDLAPLETMRERVIDYLIARGVVQSAGSRDALLEAVAGHPPELLEVVADSASAFVGHGLWAFKVRLALSLVDAGKAMNLLNEDFDAASRLDGTVAGLDLRVHERGACSTDVFRLCSADVDCLDGGTCRAGLPDVRMEVLNAGGSSAPVTVQSGGLQVLSVEYDPARTAWQGRVRYAKSDLAGAMSVLYLPHVTAPPSALAQATFNIAEFPCQPVGTGAFEQDRSDTVCCLPAFADRFTQTQAFRDFLNASAALQCAGAGIHASPPTNTTRELLAGAQDFVAGAFAGTVRSAAVLDTVQATSGYQDVLLELAEEDMRVMGGLESALPGGYRLRFFIGMAHFEGIGSTSMHVRFSQHEVVSENTKTHVFTTSQQTDFTFVRDVGVQLAQVRVSATEFLKFALVELTVPETLSADAVTGIIPPGSLRASVGFTQDTTAPPVYPCVDLYAGAGKTQIDAVLAAQSDCALQHPVCAASGPVPVGAGGKVTYMLPLGSGWWTEAELDNAGQALLPEYVFLDFMVNVVDGSGQRSLARMQTRTAVSRLSVASFCEQVVLQDGISGMLQIDLLLGLAGTEAEYADSVVEYSDVASAGGTGTLTMARNTSSAAANVVTLIVTGDDSLFTQEFAQLYSLEIEDLSSVHVVDAGKRAAVDALLASGGAFRKYEDPQSYSTMRYVPTDTLLAQCPVQQIRGVLGCATRRDIAERLVDFTTQSVLEIGPEGPVDTVATHQRAGAWLQGELGASDYVYALGYNHSRIVHERYRLDKRYRRGFMLAPTRPWSSAQMSAAGVASVLDLAQHTVFSFMVSLDLNDDTSTIPTVEMDVPSTLAMSAADLLGDPELQAAVESSYAAAMGVEPDNVVLDESSVQDAGARRRLLAPSACQFSLRVEIVIKDETEAMDFAENLRAELVKEESPVVKSIISNLNTKVRAVKPEMPAITSKDDFLPDTLVIPPPKKAPGCRDVDTWEREVTGLLGLGLAHTDANGAAVSGWVSCSQRYYKVVGGGVAAGMSMPNTTVRGASQAADWQRFYDAGTGTYPRVTDPAQQQWHWEWWDMCAEPPVGQFYSGHANEFSRAWEEIRAEARQQCCLCRRQPLRPNSFEHYKHAYSWPVVVDGGSDGFYDVDRAATLLIHTQAANFANKRSKNFDSAGAVLPATWSVEPGTGLTVTTACRAGEWEQKPGACAPCVAGTYRPLEAEHTLRTRCLACAAEKSSPAGSVALAACVCAAGFQPDAGNGCDACPANTYKDAPGDWACLACPDGSIASPGATSAAQCVTQEAYVDALGRTRLYTSVLGALMHLNYVEPAWAAPAPADQDNARMCAVSVDGTALNCPGATHPSAFSKPLVFSSTDDTLALVEYNTDDVFQRSNVLYYHGSASYPCRLVFYLTPEAPHQFAVGGVDRTDLKRTVSKLGLKVRPHYMGPAPPGFTERVLEDAAWGATTVLTTSLRALVPGIDLVSAAPAQVLRLVQFVATKRLQTSAGTDWRWIVCGQAAPAHHPHAYVYAKCAEGSDPDNTGAANLANAHVLDLRVFELSNTDAAGKSCFHQHWWLGGCDPAGDANLSPDTTNMYDGVLRWEPAIPADKRAAEQLWVYTYLMLGDSEACLAHGCDEAALYAQMPAHLAAAWQSTWNTEVQLLPGTLVTLHEREPVPVTTTPQFDTAIGLLRPSDACTVAGGGLECTDHAQTRKYPGLYAAAVDATTLVAGVLVAPVTSAVPHAKVSTHEVCTGGVCADTPVAPVATQMPALGVAAGQSKQASAYVRRETEVACGDVCAAGGYGYDPNCTPCDVDTFSTGTSTDSCTACAATTDTDAQTGQSTCVCSAGYEPVVVGANPCGACPAGTAKASSGDVACPACAADTYSLAGATACSPCPPGSDTGSATGQTACTCADGLVFANNKCEWAPTAWGGADPAGYAYASVDRLYPSAGLRASSPGFASADDASPDVHTFAAGDTAYAPGRYAVAYSSIDTALGYTGYGPYNALRHGGSAAAEGDANWAPAQYSGGAYTGSADLTGTLAGEWLALELPVAIVPTRVVLAVNSLDPATVAYSPHHFALFAYGAAGAWVKLHEEVLTAASYTGTLEQAGDSYALDLTVTACYHIFALVVPTVGTAADALSLGQVQIFGHEKYDACPEGTAADANSVCQVAEATTAPYAVSFAVSLPMTEAEFDAAARTTYKASVATVASVDASAVSIDSVSTVGQRRRLLSTEIRVETSVQAASSAVAASISTTVTVDALNTELTGGGLPQATMLAAPVVSENTCQIAGFHISQAKLTAIFA